MELKEYRAAAEAMLFAYGEPLATDRVAQVLGIEELLAKRVLMDLKKEIEKRKSGVCLLQLDDKWQLATRTKYQKQVKAVMETRRSSPLSPAALETLAVIAYNQPVSRSFIEQVRGVDSSSSVTSLLEKGLIEEAGRLDLPGRPVSFRTTEVFLRCFGLTSLEDLPDPHGADGQPLMQKNTETKTGEE